MANLRLMQPSFAAGELTPALHARVDLAKYNVGAKRLKNFFVHAHGGASNRQGTDYVAAALGQARLIPFQYNVEQAYVLEFTDYAMRVLKDGGLVSHTTDTVSEWATAGAYTTNSFVQNDGEIYRCINGHTSGASTEPGVGASWETVWAADSVVRVVTPFPVSSLADIKYSQSADVMYLTHPDHAPRMLTRSSHTAWAFQSISFAPNVPTPATPTASYNGTGSYDIDYKISAVSRLTGEESLPSAAVTVSADTAGNWEAGKYVTVSWGGSYFTKANEEWTQSLMSGTYKRFGRFYYTLHGGGDPGLAEPVAVYYQGEALAHGTLETLGEMEWDYGDADSLGFDTVYVRIKESAINWPIPSAFYKGALTLKYTTTSSANPDYYYKIYANKRGAYGYIGTSDGTDFKDDNISPDVDNGLQIAYNPFSDGNHPSVSCIFEQRLMFGRSDSSPQTVWASQTGQFNNFGISRPLRDTDSIEATLASTQVNEIRWLIPFSAMMVFTSGGEWLMANGNNSDALTPTSVQYKVQGHRGCADVRPIVIGDIIVYVQRGGQVVRDLQYRLETDKYGGNNLSVLSEHLFRNKQIMAWAYQQTPNSIIWVVLDDGTFCSFTYLPEHEVWAWCPQETEGVVEEVASIPGDDEDEVYFVVRRTINGSVVRYIEKLHTRDFTSTEDAYFVDCGLTYDGEPATVILGLDHLAGETVSILADGNVVAPQEVVEIIIPDAPSGWGITLPQEASVVHVGLPYTSTLETLNVDLSGQGDTLQGKRKVISKVTLRLEDTREMWIGPDADHLVQVPFRTDEGYEEETRLYTGDKQVTIRSSWGTNGRIMIRQTDPLPVTVLAVIPEVSPGG